MRQTTSDASGCFRFDSLSFPRGTHFILQARKKKGGTDVALLVDRDSVPSVHSSFPFMRDWFRAAVMGEAELAFEHIFELQARLERMNQELADRTDYESEEYHQLIDRFTHENDRFLMMGGTNYQAEIERTLLGLGFSREDFERPTSEFSGGWRMRIEFAKLLLRRPDVLLLDEPTNHLDIESIQWLENFLATRANAVVLVSHDRAFLIM